MPSASQPNYGFNIYVDIFNIANYLSNVSKLRLSRVPKLRRRLLMEWSNRTKENEMIACRIPELSTMLEFVIINSVQSFPNQCLTRIFRPHQSCVPSRSFTWGPSGLFCFLLWPSGFIFSGVWPSGLRSYCAGPSGLIKFFPPCQFGSPICRKQPNVRAKPLKVNSPQWLGPAQVSLPFPLPTSSSWLSLPSRWARRVKWRNLFLSIQKSRGTVNQHAQCPDRIDIPGTLSSITYTSTLWVQPVQSRSCQCTSRI